MKNPEISEIEPFGCLAVLQSCGILPLPAVWSTDTVLMDYNKAIIDKVRLIHSKAYR